MIKKDYLERQIDQFGKALGIVLAKLLGVKTAEEIDVVEATITKTLEDQLELSFEELLNLSNNKFMHLLLSEKGLKSYHLENLSEIFYQLGKNHSEDSNSGLSCKYFQKALVLFEHIESQSELFDMDRSFKINELKNLSDD